MSRLMFAAATEYWAKIVGVPAEAFRSTSLKKHNPRTIRKNVGHLYHGCLVVSVRTSKELLHRIIGWFDGIVGQIPSRGDGPA